MTWRDLAGFLAAALAPALLIFAAMLASGSAELAVQFFIAAFALAFIHVALIAMPAFAFLARRRRPTLTTVLVASILVGALPVLMLGFATGEPSLGGTAILGAFGLSGGLAFALMARPPIRR